MKVRCCPCLPSVSEAQGSRRAIAVYAGFIALLVGISYIGFLFDQHTTNDRLEAKGGAAFTSAPLPDENGPGLLANAVIKGIDPVSGTCTVIFRLRPTGSVVQAQDDTQGTAKGVSKESGSAAEAIEVDRSLLRRPVVAQTFALISRGVRRTFDAGSRIPNQVNVTLPFFRSSIRGYPFDSHTAVLDLSAALIPGPVNNATKVPRTALPVQLRLDTDIGGFKFDKASPRPAGSGATGPFFVETEFRLIRSNITIGFSLFIVGLNWILSILMVFLAMQIVVRGRQVVAAMLGPPISLLFALPSLRNAQPAAPPVGATSDVIGFFWNMALVAISAVIIIQMFILQWKPPAKHDGDSAEKGNSAKAVGSPVASPASTGSRANPSLVRRRSLLPFGSGTQSSAVRPNANAAGSMHRGGMAPAF